MMMQMQRRHVAGGCRSMRGAPAPMQRRAIVGAEASVSQQQQYAPLPRNVEEMVDGAAAAIRRAATAAKSPQARFLVDLINPVNEKGIDFCSTEATDYPCSTFTEFNSLVGVTKRLIARCGKGASGVLGSPCG
jgi:hypothetical protein